MEDIVVNLIANAGEAKSKSYEAIYCALDGEIEKAVTLLEESDEVLNRAHNTQTGLITDEINGENIKLSLLMVHAQDHLMTAIEVRSLADVFIKAKQD